MSYFKHTANCDHCRHPQDAWEHVTWKGLTPPNPNMRVLRGERKVQVPVMRYHRGYIKAEGAALPPLAYNDLVAKLVWEFDGTAGRGEAIYRFQGVEV